MEILKATIANNELLKEQQIEKLLFIIDPAEFYVGDSCILISYLRQVKDCFKGASIYVNYNDTFKDYADLLENNPFITGVSSEKWDHIPIEDYQMVILLTGKEESFLDLLDRKFGEKIKAGVFEVQFYSMTSSLDKKVDIHFPPCHVLNEYMLQNEQKYNPLHELFLTSEEKRWGDSWLEANGLENDEHVIVLIDDTTSKNKLLRANVYFDILEYLCNYPKVKFLVLDKYKSDKAMVYKAWLQEKSLDRIIFGSELSLRSVLSILGSKYIKVVFGPCTGLMHCSAGIVGQQLKEGRSVEEAPAIIVYTGQYPQGAGNAHFWWGRSLVDCWVLHQNQNSQKEIFSLTKESEIIINSLRVLPCSEYDSNLIIKKLSSYKNKFKRLFNIIEAESIDQSIN